MSNQLLKEATTDDRFNAHLSKLQDAIIGLEKTSKDFSPRYPRPVKSQLAGIEVAIADLEKVRKTLADILEK